jgi:peptidoglycan/xylan/chitin deacetylase (PgdA/CDA1 family)
MKTRKPIEVCITVDTEFSIGGNFENPALAPVGEPIVLGSVGGKEQGLGFLLDSLAEFGLPATFFVEALQTAYFGDEPMGSIATRIAEAGHDVQLHLHPCWLYYEGAEERSTKPAPNDSCAGRTDTELDHFFRSGLSTFLRWGLPSPVAVRPGNFEFDTNFHRAAARSGLRLSSSIAVPIYRPIDEHLNLVGGKQRIGEVLELPVFCYTYGIAGHNRLRPLSITACSSAEIVLVLQRARLHRISPIVILTHPHEYIKRKDFRYSTIRRNRVNQARLRVLLEFLRRNQDDFITLPICAINDDESETAGLDRPAVAVPFRPSVVRMLENGINDRIWWY